MKLNFSTCLFCGAGGDPVGRVHQRPCNTITHSEDDIRAVGFRKLCAGSYETNDGRFAITASATTKGYWDIYTINSAGDLNWIDVVWTFGNAKLRVLEMFLAPTARPGWQSSAEMQEIKRGTR